MNKSYFSHDEGARNDPKLIKVLMKLGQTGKGVFWDLVEMLYEQNGYLMLSDCDSYAFALRTDCEVLKTLIADFDLFENDGERFWSNTVLHRLELRNAKSKKASQSAAKRWNNADAMRSHSDGNAIKENEIKENEIKENKETTPLSEAAPAEGAKILTDQQKADRAEEKKIYNSCKAAFISFYLDTFSEEPYLVGVDAAKIKSLIKKISFKMREKSGEAPSSEQLINTFDFFIKSSYKYGSEWLLNNFKLSNLDSQFNELFILIKNNGKTVEQSNNKNRTNSNGLSPLERAARLYGGNN